MGDSFLQTSGDSNPYWGGGEPSAPQGFWQRYQNNLGQAQQGKRKGMLGNTALGSFLGAIPGMGQSSGGIGGAISRFIL